MMLDIVMTSAMFSRSSRVRSERNIKFCHTTTQTPNAKTVPLYQSSSGEPTPPQLHREQNCQTRT
ncbi:hypothetical protein Vi05172_g5263 [Venturia inaequalis]|nr:hypothetical protein Vi05172_g5263 [Venturia inaequalis]